jgi:hypothetical protein
MTYSSTVFALAVRVAAGNTQRARRCSPGSDAQGAERSRLPPGIPKLVGDEVEPLMPEELTKTIRDVPRDPEVIDVLRNLSGAGPLPPR